MLIPNIYSTSSFRPYNSSLQTSMMCTDISMTTIVSSTYTFLLQSLATIIGHIYYLT
ncbi:hypothetical protein I4U23_004856 [Adineta vaga]|nr:hypothetical protein I4U23_004856 [Adineta vaga]